MPRDARKLLLAALGCALALIPALVLAYFVDPTERLDAAVLRRFAEADHGAVHALSAATVALGETLPVLAILATVVAIGVAAGRSRQALAGVAIVLGAQLTTQVLKQLLSHARAQAELHGFHLPWADAFPSGHTTAAASLAVALLLVVPPLLRPAAAALGAAFTVAMGVAVVVLQWHYPSDVVGGVLVVGAWSFAALAVLAALRPRRPARPRGQRETGSGRFAVSFR